MYIRFSSAIQSAKLQSYRHWESRSCIFMIFSCTKLAIFVDTLQHASLTINIRSFKRNCWRKHKREIDENDNHEWHLIYIPIFVFDLVYILGSLNLCSDSYLFLYFVPAFIAGRYFLCFCMSWGFDRVWRFYI